MFDFVLKDCDLYKLSLSSEILQGVIILKNKQNFALNRWREVETGSGVSRGEGKPFHKARKELPPSDKVEWLMHVQRNNLFPWCFDKCMSIIKSSLCNQSVWTVTHSIWCFRIILSLSFPTFCFLSIHPPPPHKVCVL